MAQIKPPYDRAEYASKVAALFPCKHLSPDYRLYIDARGTRRVYQQCSCGLKMPGEIAWRKRPDIEISRLSPFDKDRAEEVRNFISEAHIMVRLAMARARSAEWWKRLAQGIWHLPIP